MKGAFFLPLHPRTLDKPYLTEKRDVHFALELMYEQCVTSAGCKKNVYETISFSRLHF